MPTAGKLVAALLFAALGFVAAELFKPAMPDGTSFGPFSFICAGIGAVSGWLVIGPRAGGGRAVGISTGLQAALTMAFFCLLGFSIYLMVGLSLRKIYDGPMEAISGVFELMIEHGLLMLSVPVLGVLLIGGPICGLISDWAGRRWT